MAHISTMEELGSSAPEFSLLNTNPTVGGQTVSMTAMNEQPALLVAFICNHCAYVIHIRDSFVNFVSEYQEKGLAVVAISASVPKKIRQAVRGNKSCFFCFMANYFELVL